MALNSHRLPDPEIPALHDYRLERLNLANEQMRHRLAGMLGSQASDEDRRHLKALIDVLPDHVWIKDRQGRFVLANQAIAADMGLDDPAELIGKSDLDLWPPAIGARLFAAEQQLLAGDEAPVDREERRLLAPGRDRWFLTTRLALRDDAGAIIGLVGTSRDITDRKKGQLWRDAHHQILEMMATNADLDTVLARLIGIVEAQLNGIIGAVLLTAPDGSHFSGLVAPGLPRVLRQICEGLPVVEGVTGCATAAARREPVFVTDMLDDDLWTQFHPRLRGLGLRSAWSLPIRAGDGVILGTFDFYSPLARLPEEEERRLIDDIVRIAGIAIVKTRADRQIRHMAHHDALTGLPNRSLLNDRLGQAICYARRYGGAVTVAFIDLDHFKAINDSLGHNAGDQLLKTIAQRMMRDVRASDTVVRLGGDEFVIVLNGRTSTPDDMLATLKRIRATIAEPVELAGQSRQVTCSMGLASFPRDGDSVDSLLANADAAMYRAKESGRDNFQFFTAEFNATVHERQSLRDGLRHALARDEFTLVYQPQLDLRDGHVIGVEALIRWHNPELGEVAPARFIPVAEESGLFASINDWVLRQACAQVRTWLAAGLDDFTISVNVSPRQFRNRHWPAQVGRLIEEMNIPPACLELEFAESLVMEDPLQATGALRALAALGVGLAIDDFGTGHSNLAALKNFPINRLKIDRSLVQHVTSDPGDGAIVTMILSLAHTLHLRVVAECVETEGQFAFLKANGCDEMQGYYFSRPLTVEGAESLLAGQSPRRQRIPKLYHDIEAI